MCFFLDKLNKLRNNAEEFLSTNNLAGTQEVILHQIDSKLDEIKIDVRSGPILSLEWDKQGLTDIIGKMEIKIGVFRPLTQELIVVSSQDLVSVQSELFARSSTIISFAHQIQDDPLSTQSDLESES